jgi:hypothetical protein
MRAAWKVANGDHGYRPFQMSEEMITRPENECHPLLVTIQGEKSKWGYKKCYAIERKEKKSN